MIHQVALRFENGIVLSLGKPHRHRDIIRLACEQFGWDAVPVHEQGFIWSSTGEFMDRETAAQRASMFGQIREPKRELFSEDLW